MAELGETGRRKKLYFIRISPYSAGNQTVDSQSSEARPIMYLD